MARSVKIKVTGGRELSRKFDQLEDVGRGRNLETALVAGGLVLQNAAKQNLRDNKTWITGNLARSVHIGGHSEQSELANSTGGDVGGNVTKATSAEVLIGTDVEYAKPIEYGTGPRVIRPKDKKALFWKGAAHPVKQVKHPGTPAKSFIRKAFDEKGKEAVEEVQRVLRKLLGRVAP